MTAHAHQDLDQLSINTIRTLSMDAVQQAKSGHPGYADGDGAGRLHAVAALPALRSGQPDLAEPRSLRAVDRSCLDAAVFDAPPDRREVGQPEIRGARARRRSASTTSAASGRWTASVPGIPNTV